MSLAKNVHRSTVNPKQDLKAAALQEGLTHLRLEDITLSKAALEDVNLFGEGKISKKELIEKTLLRIKQEK